MICLLQSVEVAKDKLRVGAIHFKPETHLTQEKRNAGIMVDVSEKDLPQPERRRGESAVLYFNPTTEAFWYEYEPRSFTQEELLESIAEKLDILIGQGDAARA